MSDLVLVRRLLRGDDAAFEEFFEGYFPRLYRFARFRLGGDADAAEEVTQATLIRAIQKIHTFRGEAALFTWLCTLCRREISTWLDRAGRMAELPLIDDHPDVRLALEAIAGLGDDPEVALRQRELSRFVHAVLDYLPHRYGDALEWRYIDGLSVPEVADRLGLGYKAAESVLSRARQAFREAFAVVSTTGLGALRESASREAPGS